MNIVLLEKIDLEKDQIERLQSLGDVASYESSSESECLERITGADIVVVDWVDPSPFILSMKSPSLLALMSTGFDWIKYRDKAREKDILLSNIPGYSTEAVAEHLIGLALNLCKGLTIGDRFFRKAKESEYKMTGFELKGKTLGVIGLGQIGKRLSEIAHCFGMKVITYNRQKKNNDVALDVSLEELLNQSDVVGVCCSLNDDSRHMIDSNSLKLVKSSSVIVGATWGVVVESALLNSLRNNNLAGAGFDLALEAGANPVSKEFREIENVVFTPHSAYRTIESKRRQTDILLANIEAFANGNPQNIVN